MKPVEFGLFSYYPECLADGWCMLNITVSIGETSRSLAHRGAPSGRELVPPRCGPLAERFVRLRVLRADSRSVSLLPPPTALSPRRVSLPLHSSAPSLLLHRPLQLSPAPIQSFLSPSLRSFGASAPIWAGVGSFAGVGVILGSVCVFLLTRSAECESTAFSGRLARILPKPRASVS